MSDKEKIALLRGALERLVGASEKDELLRMEENLSFMASIMDQDAHAAINAIRVLIATM